MKKSIFFCIIQLLFLTTAVPKSFGQIAELHVGDVCPDVKIANVINYNSTSVSISDFRGKWLILDFWATWCKPCVGMLFKTDSLKKQIGEAVEFFPITTQKTKIVADYLKFLQKENGLKVPSATEDTTLTQMFKHVYIPHYVWIDPAGKIAAITGYEDITLENINKAINSKQLNMTVKKDVVKNRDMSNPFFFVGSYTRSQKETSVDEVEPGKLLFNSVLTSYIQGIPGGAGQDSFRISMPNQTIMNLFGFAAGHFTPRFAYSNSYLWEVTDTSLFHFANASSAQLKTKIQRENWIQENTFSYELITPHIPLSLNQRTDIMLNDLNEKFGALYNIQGGVQKRTVKCIVLKQTTAKPLYQSTDTLQEPEVIEGGRIAKVTNEPILYFINCLRYPWQMLPTIVDGTGFMGKVDIQIENVNLSRFEDVNKALEKYGLKFVEEVREADMIVVSDKKAKQ